MKSRLITALFALPVLTLSIVLPLFVPQFEQASWLFILIAAFAFTSGLFEFYTITKKLELKADASIAFVGAAALFVAFLFDAPKNAPDLLILTVTLFLMLVLSTQMFRFQKDFSKMLTGIGITVFGVLYVVFLGGFLVATRVGFDPVLSSKLLLFFFFANFGSDAGAYFIGKNLGKHKLAPKISPGKTWEGFIGGIVASVAFAALAVVWFFPELPYQFALPLAAVMSIVGCAGDLAESAMKRGAAVKDAANFLPGHGGLLDRLDSLLFNAPILYYFARFYF
ncbi:MAG: Phosphatidate cytidylyltransferase [uncultured Pyrinomonadaceae bacterium]|uniref:Phosphatidate cytidylyltransferase n=1 Tax=uncultured Pyrinomonadaceae bacterium TaxID=2283094 RepID=A0A6J4NFU0_9BACT|nr:MAG: Phosphatidate cytidylyltransferase [uncultured Pyrinomonadaceae bacterium]